MGTCYMCYSSGEDVLEGLGCYWSFPSAGQRSRRSVQAETTHSLTSVHWPGLLRDLFNLFGKFFFFFLQKYPSFMYYLLLLIHEMGSLRNNLASIQYVLAENVLDEELLLDKMKH